MEITKELLIDALTNSNNRNECFSKLGLKHTGTSSYKKLNYYIKLYKLEDTISKNNSKQYNFRRNKITLDDIFKGKHPFYSSSHLRTRLIKEKVFTHKCSMCLLTEWNGSPIPLDLDHIDGVPTNHALTNLRLLCRNCHAQTETFCSKNVNNKKNIKAKAKQTKINNRIDMILNSGVDFSKHGWVTKIAKIIGIREQKVGQWMKVHMNEFYNNCYKRMAGNGGVEPPQ